MGKIRVRELLPFFALIAVVAMLSTATLATASLAQKEYAFPNLYNKWSWGCPVKYQPGAATAVTDAYVPTGGVMASSGISAPAGDFSLSGQMTVIPTVQKKLLTPEGPRAIMRRQISINPIAHL